MKGQKVLTAHGLADNSTPVMVVANADQADDVASAMTGIDNLEDPSEPVVKDGVAFITANLTVDSTTNAAFDTVDEVRTKVHAVDGADALVSGTLRDPRRHAQGQHPRLQGDHPGDAGRGAADPDAAAAGADGAADPDRAPWCCPSAPPSGSGALAFKYLFDYPAVDPSFPLFVFVFLVSLGIDYNIFLMTRVREETAVRGTREGSLVGLAATGGVITSAGLVLAATFAILASLPLVFLVELGLHRRAGGADRHDHHPLGAGDRDQPRPRQQDLVAEQARPRSQRARRPAPRRTGPSTGPTYPSTPERSITRSGFMTVTPLLSRSCSSPPP